MPMVGLGTFDSKDETLVTETVKHAVHTGYRHIDTSSFYMNENFIGNALHDLFQEGVVKREEMFIVTKLWRTGFGDVLKEVKSQLEKLRLDYVDLYLIHWPIPTFDHSVKPAKPTT